MSPPPIKVVLNPCISFEDLVSMSIDRLCSHYLAILTKILHRGSFWQDIVIRFKSELDLQFPLVQVKI